MSRRNNSQLRNTDRLCLNQRPCPRLQRFLHDEIHRPSQAVFQPELEAHILGQSWCFTELHQEIHIAFRSGFAPGRRSKKREGEDAEALLQFLPVRGKEIDHLVAVHSLSSSLTPPL